MVIGPSSAFIAAELQIVFLACKSIALLLRANAYCLHAARVKRKIASQIVSVDVHYGQQQEESDGAND